MHRLFQGEEKHQVLQAEKQHKGEKASPCQSCFELGLSVSDCRLTHGHCGPGVTWQTAVLEKDSKVNQDIPNCCYELSSAFITTNKNSIPADPTSFLAYTGPQTPQDYGTGFIINYTKDAWQAWLKAFELQSGTCYKVCTGMNKNKEAENGVLRQGAQRTSYTVTWRQQYTCHRGGNPRYKDSKEDTKSRNAPGSRLTQCKATLNARLLKLETGKEVLIVNFPLLSAHDGHTPDSLADLHSHKPLPEIIARVESLVCNSHLSQVSLMLALKEWVNQELIPQHMRQGLLLNRPSEYDRRYFPTVEDLRNMKKWVINKIRNNMFDQDALENFLHQEREQNKGFKYFLRKYETAKDNVKGSTAM